VVSGKVLIHGAWASRWVFILAATGSAVGLGNIWKFPYMTGMYGGGAFVIMYLLCIFLVGLPIMLGETLIGRRGRQSPVHALGALMGRVAGWMLRLDAKRYARSWRSTVRCCSVWSIGWFAWWRHWAY
jgi:SNF family Na+-dependent transporter